MGSGRRGSTRGRSPSRSRLSDRLRTPTSWLQNGARSSGPMPEPQITEGPFPVLEQDRVEANLQRMLEQEVVNKLHEENIALKREMARLLGEKEKGKGQGSQKESSAWSEITTGDKKETLPGTPQAGIPQDGRRYTSDSSAGWSTSGRVKMRKDCLHCRFGRGRRMNRSLQRKPFGGWSRDHQG